MAAWLKVTVARKGAPRRVPSMVTPGPVPVGGGWSHPRGGAACRQSPCPRGAPQQGPLFDFQLGYGPPPQIWGLSPVHILGTAKLSRLCPQAPWVRDDQTRSGGCGSVDERYPQAGDESVIHRLGTELSTDNPQAGAGCPQRSSASPHRCPLFGNATRHLTVSSERRHTKVPGWAVGKAGKAGDGAGEKWPSAVHGVCRTFRSPQKPEVVHRRRPQGRWTKFLL